ncbi:MAG: DUF2779 domain-containing protein, partial [Clostridia bacterium]|nr:DUF2779 domain-containing protein [Clostridia bacterium]
MYLSKTSYVRVWSCRKGAWITQNHPELVLQDENTLARFRTGNEVGDLARGLFGPFVNVTALKEDGSLDLPRMIENTREEMERGTSVICEASFSYEGLYCAVDLLRRNEDGWAIYEVKSSSDGLQDKYIADVSYQKYVLEHCGVNVTGVFLVCIDTSYVLGPEGLDLNGFFQINDLWEQASREQQNVPEILRTAEQVLASDQEPHMELAEGCKDCVYFQYCTRDLPSPNVFELYRLAMKKKLEYYQQGLVGFEELEKAGVIKNTVQKRQIDFALRERGTYADVNEIREVLSGLTYPLYF